MPANAADLKGNTVVDPDTTNVWTDYTRPGGQPSTQNVGRIWTDKSVFDNTYAFKNEDNAGLSGQTIGKGDSDFLVSLSALFVYFEPQRDGQNQSAARYRASSRYLWFHERQQDDQSQERCQ